MYIIYTISNCSYCNLTKNLLKLTEYIVINCDALIIDTIQKSEFIKEMNIKIGYEKFQNKLSFPIIFSNDYYVGGYNELKQHIKTDDELVFIDNYF